MIADEVVVEGANSEVSTGLERATSIVEEMDQGGTEVYDLMILYCEPPYMTTFTL